MPTDPSSKKQTINEKLIDRVFNKDKTYFVRDDQLKGFGLKVLPSPSKQKNFIVEARLGGVGRSIRRNIGSSQRYNAKEARKIAEDYLRKIRENIDP